MKGKITEYQRFMDEELYKYKTGVEIKRKAGEKYESILDSIRMNVVMIFSQLFKKAVREVETNSFKLLDKYTAETANSGELLQNAFVSLLEKIRGQWEISLSEAEKHGDDDTVVKENAKIDVAKSLSGEFERIFEVKKC